MQTSELPPVGRQLRHWRVTRGLSQLALAELAEVSTRHLSFVETGKSSPSREMVLVLASALDVPLRERNRLLLAAGYAPVYREQSFNAPEMKELQKAIDLILKSHDPFPAVVVDRKWELLASNASAQRMLVKLVNPTEIGAVMTNAFHLTFHPKGLRRVVLNWPEVSAILVQRLRREALDDPGPDGPAALLDALTQYGPLPPGDGALVGEPKLLIPLRLAIEGMELRMFTTLATLGTPIDIAAQELRIESYYPADDATDRWLRAQATSRG